MPDIKNTAILLDQFAEILRSGTFTDDELKHLLRPKTFTNSPGLYKAYEAISDSNHTRTDAMKAFVEALDTPPSPEALHKITAALLRLSADSFPHMFVQQPNLARIFLYHEMLHYPELAEAHFESGALVDAFPNQDELKKYRINMLEPGVNNYKSSMSVSSPSSSHASSSSSTTKRPVALLDVDHTLLFHGETNMDLLNALLNHDIKDVYLFTDMTFNAPDIRDRKSLINQLEHWGFTVHGVISPNDFFWEALGDELAADIFKALPRKKVVSDEFQLVLHTSLKIDYPLINTAMTEETLSSPPPGIAFRDVTENAVTKKALEDANSKSLVAKFLTGLRQRLKGMDSPKGVMFESFQEHMPEWVGDIIVVDDKPEILDTINKMRQACPVPVQCILVTQVDMGEEYYNHHLQMNDNPTPGKSSPPLFRHRIPMSSSLPLLPTPGSSTDALHDTLRQTIENYKTGSGIQGLFKSDALKRKLSKTSTDMWLPMLGEHFSHNKRPKQGTLAFALLKVIQDSGQFPGEMSTRAGREQLCDAFVAYAAYAAGKPTFKPA